MNEAVGESFFGYFLLQQKKSTAGKACKAFINFHFK